MWTYLLSNRFHNRLLAIGIPLSLFIFVMLVAGAGVIGDLELEGADQDWIKTHISLYNSLSTFEYGLLTMIGGILLLKFGRSFKKKFSP